MSALLSSVLFERIEVARMDKGKWTPVDLIQSWAQATLSDGSPRLVAPRLEHQGDYNQGHEWRPMTFSQWRDGIVWRAIVATAGNFRQVIPQVETACLAFGRGEQGIDNVVSRVLEVLAAEMGKSPYLEVGE